MPQDSNPTRALTIIKPNLRAIMGNDKKIHNILQPMRKR